jgi:hypothetical protein
MSPRLQVAELLQANDTCEVAILGPTDLVDDHDVQDAPRDWVLAH